MSRLVIKKRYAGDYGTLFKDFANGESDKDRDQGIRTFPNVTADYADTTHFLSGTSSVHIKVDDTAGDNFFRIQFLTGSVKWENLRSIDIWLYNGTATDSGTTDNTDLSMTVTLAVDAPYGLTNYYRFRGDIAGGNSFKEYNPDSWVMCHIPMIVDDAADNGEAFKTTGATAGDFTDVTYMSLEFSAAGTNIAECWLDSIYFDMESRPKLIWSFDDGNDTDYTEAFSALTAAGIKGTSFVPTSRVGDPGGLSRAQMDEMYAAGWDFGNHTVSTPAGDTLLDLSTEDAIAELLEATNTLKGWGYTRAADCVAYPGGASDLPLRRAMATAGFRMGRGTRQPYNYPLAIGHPDSPTQSGSDRFQYNIININQDTYDGGAGGGVEIMEKVERALRSNGVAFLNTHNIDLTATSTAITPTDFQDIVDQISAKHKQGRFDMLTISEYLDGLASQRLTTDRVTA